MTDTTPTYPSATAELGPLQGGLIHRAMLAVIGDIPPVDMNGEMTLGGNKVKFTRIDDIRDALNPILAKHGVVSYIDCIYEETELQVAAEPMTMAQVDPQTNLISSGGREIRDGKIPTTRSWAKTKYGMRFVFVGDNSEVTVTATGQSYDSGGDKALAKATTAAIKRIIFETFKITDRDEAKTEESDPDSGNRSATTDRRAPEGKDTGGQKIAAAQGAKATGRSGPPQAAVAQPTPEPEQPADEQTDAADQSTGEVPEPNEPPADSRLDVAKGRIRTATAALKVQDGAEAWTPAIVDALATEVTGKKTRPEWIVLPTAVEKLATALEARLDGAE